MTSGVQPGGWCATVCPQMTPGPETAQPSSTAGVCKCDLLPACPPALQGVLRKLAGPKAASYCLVFTHKCPVFGCPPPLCHLSLLCSEVPHREPLPTP